MCGRTEQTSPSSPSDLRPHDGLPSVHVVGPHHLIARHSCLGKRLRLLASLRTDVKSEHLGTRHRLRLIGKIVEPRFLVDEDLACQRQVGLIIEKTGENDMVVRLDDPVVEVAAAFAAERPFGPG